MPSLDSNPYVRNARGFSAAGSDTHEYAIVRAEVSIGGEGRSVAAEVFAPKVPEPGKLTLALLPGGALTPATNFYDLAPMLLQGEPGRRFVFVNTPGTGMSGRKVADLNHRELAQLDLAGLYAAVGADPVVLGGHSQGGGFAQTVARLNNDVASLDLRALLLLDPVPLAGAGYILWRFVKTRGSLKRMVHDVMASPDADDQLIEFFSWAIRAEKGLSRRAFLANIFAHDFPDHNHPVTAPTLILGAAASGAIRQERLQAMQLSPTYPNATYQRIESQPAETAGHLNYLSYQRTTDAITDFLRTIDPR